jgi:hypothetical protein
MIRIIIPFKVFHVVFRVHFLIYFIYFRLKGFFEKDFKSLDSTKIISIQNKHSGRVFVRGGLDTRYIT